MLCLIILYIYILYTKIYTNIYIYTHTQIYTNIHNTYLYIYIYDYIWDAPNQYKFSISYPAQLGRPDPSPICANIGSVCRCIFKKHSRVQLLNPWTPQFCLNVSCHILAVSSFVLLMGSKKLFLRDPVSTMILGFSVLYHLFPSCLQLVAHLSPTCFSLVPLSIPC